MQAAKRPRLSLEASVSSLSEGDPLVQSRMDALQKEVPGCSPPAAAMPSPSHAKSDPAVVWCANRKSQVDDLARNDSVQTSPGDSTTLEQIVASNRTQSTELTKLHQAAAQREATVASLQVQLMQARMQVQQVQEAEQALKAERDKLVAQHSNFVVQAQTQLAQQQQQLQQQLQSGLATAAQSQAAQQGLMQRMSALVAQTHQWLHSLASRYAVQKLELPTECRNALNLLESVSSVTTTLAAQGEASAQSVHSFAELRPILPAVQPSAVLAPAASAVPGAALPSGAATIAAPASADFSSGLDILAVASQKNDKDADGKHAGAVAGSREPVLCGSMMAPPAVAGKRGAATVPVQGAHAIAATASVIRTVVDDASARPAQCAQPATLAEPTQAAGMAEAFLSGTQECTGSSPKYADKSNTDSASAESVP